MTTETLIDNGITDAILHFSSKHGIERQKARLHLIEVGEKAVPYLMSCLTDKHLDVRWEAALTLRDMHHPTAIDSLVIALMDEAPGVRWLAAEALISSGLPALAPLLRGLQKHFHSIWMCEGAHHVLHDLMQMHRLPPEVLKVYKALSNTMPKELFAITVSKALAAMRAPLQLSKNNRPRLPGRADK